MKHTLTLLLLLLNGTVGLFAQANLIAVPLRAQVGYLDGEYQPVFTSYSKYSPKYAHLEFAAFKGIPDSLVEKKIRSVDFVRGQAYYESYLAGKTSRLEWERLINQFKIDTTRLSPVPIRNTINVLISQDQQNRRLVIADANNNQDFSDDKRLYYPLTLTGYPLIGNRIYGPAIKPIVDTLPTLAAAVEVYAGKKILTHRVLVKPNPYSYRESAVDSIDRRFHLTLGVHEHRAGSVTIGSRTINFLVGTGGTLSYSTPSVEIRKSNPVTVSSGTPAFESVPYRVGQTFWADDHIIEINRITPLGDTLYLEDRGVIQRPVGSRAGFYASQLTGTTIDAEPFGLNDSPGQFVLLDFWGSWCGPCIQMLPALKAAVARYADKPVRVVSLASERTGDLTALRRLVAEHQLTWAQLWETPRSANSLLKRYGIESIPTTLLIAPDGKILFRAASEAEFGELTSLLDSELAKKR